MRCAALVVGILLAAVGAAYAQDPAEATQTTETTQAPTETTPTETTPTETTPTETAPAPSPEPTAAPNEYVESVPTGGGQTPVSEAAPAAPAPAIPAAPSKTSSEPARTSADDATPAPTKRKVKKRARARRHADETVTRQKAEPVLTAPASADPGEPANPLLLGIALLMITGTALGTAIARRDSATA